MGKVHQELVVLGCQDAAAELLAVSEDDQALKVVFLISTTKEPINNTVIVLPHIALIKTSRCMQYNLVIDFELSCPVSVCCIVILFVSFTDEAQFIKPKRFICL